MSEVDSLIKVGYYKGEMDFGVNGRIANLTYEQMNELRQMLVVAIGVAEGMFQRGQDEVNDLQLKDPDTKTKATSKAQITGEELIHG